MEMFPLKRDELNKYQTMGYQKLKTMHIYTEATPVKKGPQMTAEALHPIAIYPDLFHTLYVSDT